MSDTVNNNLYMPRLNMFEGITDKYILIPLYCFISQEVKCKKQLRMNTVYDTVYDHTPFLVGRV